MIKFRSLKSRIALGSGFALFGAIGALVAWSASQLHDATQSASRAELAASAQAAATMVQEHLLGAQRDAASLAGLVSASLENERGFALSRQSLASLQDRYLSRSPDLVGLFVSLDQDALGGDDSQFVGAEGHDAKGRFARLSRTGSEGQREALADPRFTDPEGPEFPAGLLAQARSTKGALLSQPLREEALYGPSWAIEVLYPIRGTTGVVGVVGVAVDLDRVRDAMQELVGSRALPPGLTLHDSDGTPCASQQSDGAVDTELATALASGQAWCGESADRLVASAPVTVPGMAGRLGVSAALPLEALRAPAVAAAKRQLLFGAAIALVAIIGLGILMRSSLLPLDRTIAMVQDIASGNGDLTLRLPTDGVTEIRLLATSFNKFIESLQEMVWEVAETSTGLDETATDINDATCSLERNVHASSESTGGVAEHAKQVAATIDGVSASMDEMTTSIGDISQQASAAVAITDRASSAIRQSAESVEALGQRAIEIADFVKVINGISEQTNLLALNATIEAARAGEAGKGFAVVANEVKDLATAAARATDDIRSQIEAIRGDVTRAVEGAEGAGSVVDEVRQIGSTIASAVEEQNAVSNSVRSSLTSANHEVNRIASDIQSSASMTAEAAGEAKRSSAGAAETKTLSNALQTVVGRFRY